MGFIGKKRLNLRNGILARDGSRASRLSRLQLVLRRPNAIASISTLFEKSGRR
jgi:hypothetical protein